jgi:hypothetical protein
MSPRLKIVPPAVATALALAACSTPVVVQQHADVNTRMRAIATRFVHDQQQGGMAGVIADIDACYASATHPFADVLNLRDCLVLDYVGYHEDQTVGRSFGMGPLPYFADPTSVQRWKNYGLLADYRTPAELPGYMRDSNQFVQIDVAQIKAAQ